MRLLMTHLITIVRARSVLILALSFLALVGGADKTDAAEPGRLVIRFSPTLGMNVGLAVRIDGQNAGAITRGHVFEKYLSPGPHQLVVRPNGRAYNELVMMLNVRPGQTYSYVAKLPRDNLVLQPAGWPR